MLNKVEKIAIVESTNFDTTNEVVTVNRPISN